MKSEEQIRECLSQLQLRRETPENDAMIKALGWVLDVEELSRKCVRCGKEIAPPKTTFHAPIKAPDWEGELCEECYQSFRKWWTQK